MGGVAPDEGGGGGGGGVGGAEMASSQAPTFDDDICVFGVEDELGGAPKEGPSNSGADAHTRSWAKEDASRQSTSARKHPPLGRGQAQWLGRAPNPAPRPGKRKAGAPYALNSASRHPRQEASHCANPVQRSPADKNIKRLSSRGLRVPGTVEASRKGEKEKGRGRRKKVYCHRSGFWSDTSVSIARVGLGSFAAPPVMLALQGSRVERDIWFMIPSQ
ncbi:hypothetical protein K438DRAFT_1772795 [Mycena galopus ATCC 62051]|nr:hypothetical protein K438DRAFT_1772795 [Mycena galopus ATCC 62051]